MPRVRGVEKCWVIVNEPVLHSGRAPMCATPLQSGSLRPPSKSAHGFSYQAGDLESDYTPPAVDGSGTGHVHTDYDLDRQVSLVAADGIPAATLPTYDPVKGRLTSLAFSTDTF